MKDPFTSTVEPAPDLKRNEAPHHRRLFGPPHPTSVVDGPMRLLTSSPNSVECDGVVVSKLPTLRRETRELSDIDSSRMADVARDVAALVSLVGRLIEILNTHWDDVTPKPKPAVVASPVSQILERPLLKAKDLAFILGEDTKNIYAMAERGQIPGVRRHGKRSLRFITAELLPWLQGRAPSSKGSRR